MTVSPYVYEYSSDVPFVNVEGISISLNVENELVVSLNISNEIDELPPLDTALEFGNLVYLTQDVTNIRDLLYNAQGVSDDSRLKDLILGTKTNTSRTQNHYFSLTRKDFKTKAALNKEQSAFIYNNTYTQTTTLKDTKGGSVLSGLITAAHTQDDEILGLGDRDVVNLYLLVASYRTYKNRCFVGNIIKEVVMENEMTAISTNLYTINTGATIFGEPGDIWPGDTHIQNKAIMAGTYHTPDTQHPVLAATPITNLKVKDLRILNTARTLDFDNTPLPADKKPYFSPVTLSRNIDGSIHGLFSFDLKRYVLQKAKFGGLIKNLDALLSSVVVEDIKLYRKVIKVDSVGNDLTPGHALNSAPPVENDFEYFASLQQPSPFGKMSRARGRVRLLDLPGLNDQNVLSVVFDDKKARAFDSGTVEYRVEVLVNDLTPIVLKDIQKNLSLVAKQYRENESSRTASGAIAVDTTNSTKGTDADDKLRALIASYLMSVNFIFGKEPFEVFPVESWQKNLLALGTKLNPEESQRLLVPQVVENFASAISNLLVVGTAGSGGSARIYSRIANRRKTSVLLEQFTFRQRYNLKGRKEVGFDYMGDFMSPTSLVLPSVSYEDMRDRVSQEVDKYAVPNPNAPGINIYGYLSPAVVKTGIPKKGLKTAGLQVDTTKFSGVINAKLKPQMQLQPQDQKSDIDNIRESLATAGVYIQPLQASLREILFPGDKKLSESTDSDSYISVGAGFLLDDASSRAALSGSSDSIVKNPRSKAKMAYKSPLALQLFNKQIASFSRKTIPTNTKTIQGSLAAAAFNANPLLNTQIGELSNVLNFDSLVRVEYLESYDDDLGVIKPNWVMLTPQKYQKVQLKQQFLVCRLVKVKQTLNLQSMFDMQPLGTLFGLGAPRLAPKRATYKEVMRATHRYIIGLMKVSSIDAVKMSYSKRVALVTSPAAASSRQPPSPPASTTSTTTGTAPPTVLPPIPLGPLGGY